MLDEIGARLNFTYEVKVPEDRVFGIRQSNGQYNGIIGMLQRNEADLSGTALVVDNVSHAVKLSKQLAIVCNSRRDWKRSTSPCHSPWNHTP